MKKKDREILELRHKNLRLIDILQEISQISWKYKKVKERYDINSTEVIELETLYLELLDLRNEFINLSEEVKDEK